MPETIALGVKSDRFLCPKSLYPDFVVLLSGDWQPGAVATNAQILADSQSYHVKGAKRFKRPI